jgi:predicted dehydrogenase
MTIAIGLVGAGQRAARVHAPTLAGLPGVRFAGVWARSPEPVRRLAAQHGVPAYARFLELVDQCDALAFAVPPLVQADLAADAARRNRAVFLERPMAGDVAGAEQLVEAVQGNKVISQVGLAWRYADRARGFLADAVRRIEPYGGAGRLVSGHHRPGGPASRWRAQLGVLRDEGVDLVDLLEATLGRIVDVRAHGERQGWLGLMLDHQIGRYSEASMSATASPDVFRAEVEIFGRGGEAMLDCTRLIDSDTYQTMFGEFAHAVQQNRPSALDAEHGLHLQRVIESAETGAILGT